MKNLHLMLCSLAVALLLLAPAAVRAGQDPVPLALQAAEDYRQRARYPEWSSALEAGAIDPLVDARTPTRQSRLGPDGAGPRLSVWNSAVSALPGESVTLYAALAHTAAKRALLEAAPAPGTAVTDAQVTGELLARELGSLGTVAYRDDGVAPDTLAGDGLYTARFTLPAAKAPALGRADSILVKVSALLADGDVRKAAGGLLFSNPAARLTGRYTDTLRDGNLVVAAEVEVLAPGRVHITGTLANAAGQPFASAQAARVLSTPGRQWLELPFYGLAFHDRAVAGRVTLASVALASTNGMPNALGPVATNAHVSRAYSPAQFTAAPFNDPALLEQARRLQRDVTLR